MRVHLACPDQSNRMHSTVASRLASSVKSYRMDVITAGIIFPTSRRVMDADRAYPMILI
jgi:hypothetical protein